MADRLLVMAQPADARARSSIDVPLDRGPRDRSRPRARRRSRRGRWSLLHERGHRAAVRSTDQRRTKTDEARRRPRRRASPLAPSTRRLRRHWVDVGGRPRARRASRSTLTVGYQPYYTEAWSGLVMREKEFWTEHLPEGSKVELPGRPAGLGHRQPDARRQAADRLRRRHAGDRGASKRRTRDLRIVATLGPVQDQCGVFLVRPDAPDFAVAGGGDQVVRRQGRLHARRAAAPTASPRRRSSRSGVEPKEYLNQPHRRDHVRASRAARSTARSSGSRPRRKLVNEGLAKRVASGSLLDAARRRLPRHVDKELLDERPDVAEGWLKAELDAQRFLADPANADEIVRIATTQTEGFSEQDLWDSLYKPWPADQGGSEDGVRIRLPFVDHRRRPHAHRRRGEVPQRDRRHRQRRAAARRGRTTRSPPRCSARRRRPARSRPQR